MQPTMILVHGAYADSSSWDGLVAPLAAARTCRARTASWGMLAEDVADQVAATVDTDLVEDGFEVVLHGVPGDVQRVRDDGGRRPAEDQGGYLGLAGRQTVRQQ